MNPYLSIVIPAYNEEARILPTLERITAYLAQQPYTAEVLVVDDGSIDRTGAVVKEFALKHPIVGLISNPHRGKGFAVKTGMLAVTGTYRFLCDADLSMPIEELAKFLPPAVGEADVAIGSREAAGARRFDEPGYRHVMGRVFNLIVQIVAVPGLKDTQCGFKCFTAEAVDELFPLQRTNGFGFDVEILYLARKRGLRIVEVPIRWYHVEQSKVNPIRDTVQMLRDALGVRVNDWLGRYRWRRRLAPRTTK